MVAVLALGCGGTGSANGGDAVATGDATDDGGVVDSGVLADAGLVDAGAMDTGAPADAADSGTADAVGDVSNDGAADGSADAGPAHPRAGHSIVGAGALLRSSNFRMVSSLGDPGPQHSTARSPNFRLRGGLVGIIGTR